MRILVIDDDREFARTLKDALLESYLVDLAFTGSEGAYLSQVNCYDVIILDLNLPDMDGVEVCRLIRSSNVQTPIIMLTGSEELNSKVCSLDNGADDYLTKPFAYTELTARLRALLRRSAGLNREPVLCCRDITLDPVERVVIRGAKQLALRKKEYDILEYLLRCKGRVISKEELLEHVWEDGIYMSSNTLEVHISSLRKKVNSRSKEPLIKTIYGLGYKLVAF
ncbi:MAG: hypothetical protein ACD_22C00072G0012 [uncultured bacterium]|uniref:DNA-binding response regulator n=1 Tax=candidate division WWE3 bacterium RBG_16_37_10 TaxID=1802610 RepID=A0A1F4V2P5_UNCKA|nr:MAG: hypothetical protein ACD_22C00072G0012 [uncultured bacterium]OGC51340.1 MAG: hypothetical protein A2W32_04030 [candidate division WWE3 bacterium RBG_16_37_10]